jgi:hypothetical protein
MKSASRGRLVDESVEDQAGRRRVGGEEEEVAVGEALRY